MALMLNWPILLTAMGVWDFSRSWRRPVPTGLASDAPWSHLEEPLEPAIRHQEVSLSERETSGVLSNVPGPSTALTNTVPAKPTSHIPPINDMSTGPHQPDAYGKTDQSISAKSLSRSHSHPQGDPGILNTRNGLAASRWSDAENREDPPGGQEIRGDIQAHVARPGSWAHFYDQLDNIGYYRELSHVISQLPGIMEDSSSWHGQIIGLPLRSPEVTNLKPKWTTVEDQESPSSLDHPLRSLEMSDKALPDNEHAHHPENLQHHLSEELPSLAPIPASEGYDPSTSSGGHTSPLSPKSHSSSPIRYTIVTKDAHGSSGSETSSMAPRSSSDMAPDSQRESSEEHSSHFIDSESRTSSVLGGPLNSRETRSKSKSPDDSASSRYVAGENVEVKSIRAHSVEQDSDQAERTTSSRDKILPSRGARIILSRPEQLRGPSPTLQVDLQRSKRTYHHDPFSFNDNDNDDDETLHQAKKIYRPMQTKPPALESPTLPSWRSWSRSKPRTARGSHSGKLVLGPGQPRIEAATSEGTFDRYHSKKIAIEKFYSRSHTLARSEKVSLELPSLDRPRQVRAMNTLTDFEQTMVSENQSKFHLPPDPFPARAPKLSGPRKKGAKTVPRFKSINPRPEVTSHAGENRGDQLVSNSDKEPLSPRALIDTFNPRIQKFLQSLKRKEPVGDFATYLVENMKKLWDNYLEMITICSEIVSESGIKTDMKQDLIDGYNWIAMRWEKIPGTHFDWLPLRGLEHPDGKLYERDAFTNQFESLSVYDGTTFWLAHRMYDRRRERVAGTHILYFMREQRPNWISVFTPISAPKLLVKTLLIRIKKKRKLTIPSPRP